MRDIFIISKFTALETVKKKTFIISFIVMLSLIILGFNIPNFIKLFKSEASNTKSKVLLIDKDNAFKDKLISLNDIDESLDYKIENKEYKESEIIKLLEEDKYKAILYFYKDKDLLNALYYVDKMGLENNVLVDLDLINNIYNEIKLEELGLSKDNINYLNTPFNFEVKEITKSSTDTEIGISVIISIVLFFFIYYSAYQVSTSITTEKTSKIIDNLITSTKAKYIVIGKTLGIGFVSFMQLIIMLLTAFASYKLFFPANLFEDIFSGVVFNLKLIFPFLLNFALGYLFYAFLFSLVGAFVNKTEELQSVNSLVSILLFISYYISVLAPTFQIGKITKILVYIPFISPFMGASNYLSGSISLFSFIISILILIVSVILVSYLAIRIYKNAILNYGTKFSLREVVKMYKTKA